MRKVLPSVATVMLAMICLMCATPQESMAQKQVEKYDNGNKKYQGKLEDGVKIGTHKYWHENGELKLQEKYSRTGILVAVKEWDENGELLRDEKPEEVLEKLRVEQFNNIRWWTTDGGVGIHKTKGENAIDLAPTAREYTVHYVIYLENGKEVESSIRKNAPLPINLDAGGMIDGFLYGLKQFKEGERGFMKIPSRLGYGAQASSNIPAHSTLIFQVIVLKAE